MAVGSCRAPSGPWCGARRAPLGVTSEAGALAGAPSLWSSFDGPYNSALEPSANARHSLLGLRSRVVRGSARALDGPEKPSWFGVGWWRRSGIIEAVEQFETAGSVEGIGAPSGGSVVCGTSASGSGDAAPSTSGASSAPLIEAA